MDLEEFDARASRHAGCLVGLLFQGGQQCLEPLEGTRVLADPDELDTAESGGWVRRVAQVPNAFEDGSPGRDADASADQDGDFVLEDVLGGGSVRSVDAKTRHLLAILQCYFVHAHGVYAIVELCLRATSACCVTEGASEISDLSYVYGHVGVEGAGRDCERVPLVFGDGRNLQEEPLASLVFERWLVELDLDDIVGMADNTGNLSLATSPDLAI